MRVAGLSENLREVALLFLKLGAFSFGGQQLYVHNKVYRNKALEVG